MVNVYKICGLAILTIAMVAILKNRGSSMTPFVSEIAAVSITICVVTSLSPLISFILLINGNAANVDMVYIVLKAAAIAVLCQLVSDICRENGETTLANAVDFAANAEILLLSLPIITSLLQNILGRTEL